MAVRAGVVGIHPIATDELVHLVELEIEEIDGFDFGELTQEVLGQPRSNWQAAYDERKVGQNRFAFFFHCLDTAKPLLGPAGPLALPPESPVPEYLLGIKNMNRRSITPQVALPAHVGPALTTGSQAAGGFVSAR